MIFLLSVHPCDKRSKGGCSQICNRNGDKALCSCKPGYKLAKDGVTCDKGELISYNCLCSHIHLPS